MDGLGIIRLIVKYQSIALTFLQRRRRRTVDCPAIEATLAAVVLRARALTQRFAQHVLVRAWSCAASGKLAVDHDGGQAAHAMLLARLAISCWCIS
jgi:hypothetical protein